MPVKIVVSGGFGVGKTTLIGSLSEVEPLTTEAAMTTAAAGIDHPGTARDKASTTVALDFGRITIDSSVILYLFGTPGQDRFGFNVDPHTPVLAVDARSREPVKAVVLSLLHVVLEHIREQQGRSRWPSASTG
jgi:signal recognition particle receptor subunit beta